jgi:hypothetical protein
VRVSVLSGGHRVCEPVHLDVCDRRRDLHPGTNAVRQELLQDWSGVCQWDMYDVHRFGPVMLGGRHVLRRRRWVHRRFLQAHDVPSRRNDLHRVLFWFMHW